MSNELNLNKKILEEIKSYYEDLLATNKKIGKLPNKTIAGLLDINEKTFSSGLNVDGYLLGLLPKLYNTLKNHSNYFYKKLSQTVLDITIREMVMSIGVTDFKEIETAFNRVLNDAPTSGVAGGGMATGVAISYTRFDIIRDIVKAIFSPFFPKKVAEKEEKQLEYYLNLSLSEKEKLLEILCENNSE
jgi:hypothetical protein